MDRAPAARAEQAKATAQISITRDSQRDLLRAPDRLSVAAVTAQFAEVEDGLSLPIAMAKDGAVGTA